MTVPLYTDTKDRALQELLRVFPVGLLVLSEDKQIAYYNDEADLFYRRIFREQGLSGTPSCGSVLYGLFVNQTQRQRVFPMEQGVYLVTVESLPLQPNASSFRAHALSMRCEGSAEESTRNKFGLTNRELVIARLVLAGYSNREIAAALFLSIHTVNRHMGTLLAKTGARSRIAAAGAVFRSGENGEERAERFA